VASDKDVIKDWEEAYNESLTNWAEYYDEAYTDLKYYVGDQWSESDKKYLKGESRNALVFNKIRRIIKMITGYQRKNRLSSIIEPQEGNDQNTADIFSDLLLWVMNNTHGYEIISSAFEGACITGANLLSIYMSYDDDRVNGDIKIVKEPFNAFMLDPYFTQADLSDCRYLLRRRYVSKDDAKGLLPGKNNDIDKLKSNNGNDGRFTYMPYSRKDSADLFAYDEYWKRVSKKRKLLVDRSTGETRLWEGGASQLSEFKGQFPWVDIMTVYEKSVELNVILNGELMYSGSDPFGLGDYPFVPVLGFYESQYDDYSYKLQGVVRCMRDPQTEFNKRRSKMIDILDSQVNSGWIYKEGTLRNPLDVYKTGQGVSLVRTQDSQPGDLERIPPAESSQSLFALSEELNRDIMEIPGANEELLGVADAGNTQMSGVLAKVRSANGLTTLQDLFDNLSFAQKLLGNKIVKLIQANFTPEKVERITQKQPTPEFYQKDFGKYDCVTVEGMLTDTQRAMHYAQLIQAKSVGINIPDSAIIKALPIQNKAELMDAFEQEQQAAQQQQAKIAEQEELQMKLASAEVISKLSLSKERQARAKADIGLLIERTSEASQNNSLAVLNQVKAMSEISGMEQDRIMNALQFIMALQDKSEQEDKEREAISSIEASIAPSELQQKMGM